MKAGCDELYDLIKIMSSDHLFGILEYLKNNPGSNASAISREMGVHIVTVQKILDGLCRYGFVDTTIKKGIGRPSKLYTFRGGEFKININDMLDEYAKRSRKIRELENENVQFNFDVGKEIVNAVIIGGRRGMKIIFDEKEGSFISLIPPPGSSGKTIEELAEKSAISVLDAVQLTGQLIDYSIVEVVK